MQKKLFIDCNIRQKLCVLHLVEVFTIRPLFILGQILVPVLAIIYSWNVKIEEVLKDHVLKTSAQGRNLPL